MGKVDRHVAALARQQHGVFDRRQARQLGITRPMERSRLTHGAWEPSGVPGVFRLASTTPTWLMRLWAVWLWAGAGAVVSHRAAAALLGLDRMSPSTIELTLPREAKHDLAGVVLHRPRQPPSRVIRVEGLPVTSAEDTVVGLAAIGLAPDVVDDALESALRLGHTTVARLRAVAAGRRGGAVVASILTARAPGRPRGSVLEGMWLRLLTSAGLGEAVRQYPVRVGVEQFFLDFAIPAARIGIELDGFDKLGTKADKQAFLRRTTLLQASGWRMLHFSWDDVTLRPEYVLETILLALAS